MRSHRIKCAVAGGLAGIVNGFFGGGGGMILVPLLTKWIGLPTRKAFATSVSIILPLCAVSAVIYLIRTPCSVLDAIPYLCGGLVGGLLGGKWFRHIPVQWLHWIFCLFLLYGGVKSLFFLPDPLHIFLFYPKRRRFPCIGLLLFCPVLLQASFPLSA